MCLFITQVEKRFYVNKTRMDFVILTSLVSPYAKMSVYFFLQFWFVVVNDAIMKIA